MAENSTATKRAWMRIFPNWAGNNIEEKPYLCQHCDARFKLPKAIMSHHSAKHEGKSFHLPEKTAGPGNVLPNVKEPPFEAEVGRKRKKQRQKASRKKRKKRSNEEKLFFVTEYDKAIDKASYCQVKGINNQRDQ